MTVRSRVRSNLFAHLVESHGWEPPPPRRRTRPVCASCLTAALWAGCKVGESWAIARNCARQGR